jgi:ubiquinone/menaquinone biosynthesis C-methylase UbiE
MGIYADILFPRLMDWIMDSPKFHEQRTLALAGARGSVLEIGFGTGLNLPHYPRDVVWLTILDPAKFLPARVTQRIASAYIPVEVVHQSAERLPFDDATFDCVVSTWTLCTIPDPLAALREARRALKPGGLFLFLEHGRSDEPRVAIWQDRLNPIQRVIGCGCNLNRPIDRFVREAGLHLTRLDRFVMPDVPRLAGEMYRGCATR